MPRNSDRRLLPGVGNSQRESRLHFERLIICAQTLLVTIQQARLRQRFNILMHPPVISAEGNGERTNAPSGVSMHMAQKLKTPGRHNPRESLEGFEAHMPFGVPLCQLATLCAMPGIHEAATHVVEVISDVNPQFLSIVLFLHRPWSLASRTAALKSSISCSGLSKR